MAHNFTGGDEQGRASRNILTMFKHHATQSTLDIPDMVDFRPHGGSVKHTATTASSICAVGRASNSIEEDRQASLLSSRPDIIV